MGAFSRNKGARAERELCALLRDNFGGDWKRVEAWPSYLVSDAGLVWSEASSRLLRGLTSRDGYKKIHLTGRGFHEQRFVHRLVAELFVSGEGEQVRHIDGNKLNNAASNLAWGTCRENAMDKWRHGKMPHGRTHHATKLSEAAVREIRNSDESNQSLGEKFGVTRQAIRAVRIGKSHGWLK